MNRLFKFGLIVVLCVLSFVFFKSFANNQTASTNQEMNNIVVEIDYGELRPSRTVETSNLKGSTALTALQSVAKVETHPVDHYIFVTAIDDVQGKRGEMAWYYTVDSEKADKLAYLNVLKNGAHVKWSYKKDVCSATVDK